MGMIVLHNDEIVWSPALRTGQLFLGQTQLFEQLLQLPSGIEMHVDDELQIDVERFTVFVQSLVDWVSSTRSDILMTLATGYVQCILGLHAHITGAWMDVPPSLEHLLPEARTLIFAA